MNKTELINAVAEANNLSKKDAAVAVAAVVVVVVLVVALLHVVHVKK